MTPREGKKIKCIDTEALQLDRDEFVIWKQEDRTMPNGPTSLR